ncbi:MAG: hypothetical protein IK115_01025 [Lachnospiraceae bacterium]|nr:hypothetical protein [Lachnospiraceae bacterium]
MPNGDLAVSGELSTTLHRDQKDEGTAIRVSTAAVEGTGRLDVDLDITPAGDTIGNCTGMECANEISNAGLLNITSNGPVKRGMVVTEPDPDKGWMSLGGSTTVRVLGSDSIAIGSDQGDSSKIEISGLVFAVGGLYGIYTEQGISIQEGWYVRTPEDGMLSDDAKTIVDTDGKAAASAWIDRETPYNVWVGETRVTPTNRRNIPGVTGGTASYDPKTYTLKFEGDHCNVEGLHDGAYIETKDSYLNIEGNAEFFNAEAVCGIRMEDTAESCLTIDGNVQVTAKENAVYAPHKELVVNGKLRTDVTTASSGYSINCRKLRISPGAEVKAASEETVADVIWVEEDMVIDGGSVTSEGGASIAGVYVNGDLSVNNGRLSAAHDTLGSPVAVLGKTQMTDSSAEISGTSLLGAAFTAKTDLLLTKSILKVTASGNTAISSLGGLYTENSDITASSKKTAIDVDYVEMNYGKLRADGGEKAINSRNGFFLKDVEILTPAGGKLSGDKTTIVCEDGTTIAESVLIDGGNLYDVWVGNTQISDKNADNIPLGEGSEGSAHYDRASKTLFFTEAGISVPYAIPDSTKQALIYSEEDLTIDGDLALRAPNALPADYGVYVKGDHSLHLDGKLTGVDKVATLIYVPEGSVYVSGEVESNIGQAIAAENLEMNSAEFTADDKGQSDTRVVEIYDNCTLKNSVMSVTASGDNSIPVECTGKLVMDDAALNIVKGSDGNYCVHVKKGIHLKDYGSISIESSGEHVNGLQDTELDMGIAEVSILMRGADSVAVDSPTKYLEIECGKFTASSTGKCVVVDGYGTLGASVSLEGYGAALEVNTLNMWGGTLKASNLKNDKSGAILVSGGMNFPEDIVVAQPEGGSITTDNRIVDKNGEIADLVCLKGKSLGVPECWNLFSCPTATFKISELSTGGSTVVNSNKKSEKYYNATLQGSTIYVMLREGVNRKAAAKPADSVLEFILEDESVVTYVMNVEYVKPKLKLSSTSATFKEGVFCSAEIQVLEKTEFGNYAPYDMSGMTVKYGSITEPGYSSGRVILETDKAIKGEKLSISAPGWDCPVELRFNMKSVKKDVISLLSVRKSVTLNKNISGQSFVIPVALNGAQATPETVEIAKGSEVATLGSDGKLVISLAQNPAVGNYTVELKQKDGKAKARIKVKVSDTALDKALSFKVQSKYNVLTGQKMLLVPAFKDAEVTIYNFTILEAPAGATGASDGLGNYVMDLSNCGLSAKKLNIGDIKLKAVLYGGEEVTITVKGVKAKAGKPTVRTTQMKVIRDADAVVKSSVNIVSCWKDAAGYMHTLNPVKVEVGAAKGAEFKQNEMDDLEFATLSMAKKSGSLKVTLIFPGEVKKTITLKAKAIKPKRS